MRICLRFMSALAALSGVGLIFILNATVTSLLNQPDFSVQARSPFLAAAIILPLPFILGCAACTLVPPTRYGIGRISAKVFQWAMIVEGALFLSVFFLTGVLLDAMNFTFAVLFALCIFFPWTLSTLIQILLTSPDQK